MSLAQTLSSFVNHHHNTFDNRMSPNNQQKQEPPSPVKSKTPDHIENKTQVYQKGHLSQPDSNKEPQAPMIISEPHTKIETYQMTAAN